MKKIIALVLCTILALTFTACTAGDKSDKKNDDAQTGSNAQIANPITDFGSVDEATKAAGFDITAPDEIDGKKLTLVQGIKNADETGYDIISLSYGDGEIMLRKGRGADDVSGDYNEYADIAVDNIGGKSVTMRGIENNVYKATWTDGDFSYSVVADNGLSHEDISAIATKLA